MFIHPVSVIIFLCLALFATVTWTTLSARRRKFLTARAVTQEGKEDALNERVSVLEKIVTDPADRLSREIEGLRSTIDDRGPN